MPVSRDDGTNDAVFRPNGFGPEATAPPAGVARRVAARLIDTLLLMFPSSLLIQVLVDRVMGLPMTTLESLEEIAEGGASPLFVGDIAAAFILFGLWVGYETYFVTRWGRTPGKMLVGIKVIPVNEDIIPLGVTAGDASRRAMLLNLPTAAAWTPSLVINTLNVLVIVSAAWALWDRPYRQGLHDKIVRTRVVQIVAPRHSRLTADPRRT
ncbi:RDD family protein [Spiractinospora alimapuensis]|uniref:RDD family protein n=1 Tax=Spiractinospora alimapuensis TaxID=2820884 RepID=UPI001F1FBAF4|nr:RDD family protein [Spiractinospora alimapuensis]QVQ52119.1 RDD family protein [Spiractinospora alimapuensis]